VRGLPYFHRLLMHGKPRMECDMKLLLIDGNSLINRAFYAIKGLSNKNGVFTNAIAGFFSTLQRLRKNHHPDCIAVAFDLRAPTFRHEMYDGYKKSRKGMPEELAVQMPYIKQILDYMGIRRAELSRYEADDIIGTLSQQANAESVLIATGDRDSFQLVNDKVSVVLASSKEEIIYTPEAIAENYEIVPEQFIEIKALMGDSSDDIPGVPGIGEKTAFSLIHKHGSVQQIYDNLDKLEITKSVKTKLENGRELCFLSRDLAKIKTDVPIETSLEHYRIEQGEPQKLAEILTELEMYALLKKLKLSPVALPPSKMPEQPEPPELFETPDMTTASVKIDVQELRRFEKELTRMPLEHELKGAEVHVKAVLKYVDEDEVLRCPETEVIIGYIPFALPRGRIMARFFVNEHGKSWYENLQERIV
jgi:DNA polymerase-1